MIQSPTQFTLTETDSLGLSRRTPVRLHLTVEEVAEQNRKVLGLEDPGLNEGVYVYALFCHGITPN